MTLHVVFIIISDINMPGMNGKEMRRVIDKNEWLRRKSIPFVFYTTHADRRDVLEAYELIVQGFFVKQSSVDEIKETVSMILQYWRKCLHPNNC